MVLVEESSKAKNELSSAQSELMKARRDIKGNKSYLLIVSVKGMRKLS